LWKFTKLCVFTSVLYSTAPVCTATVLNFYTLCRIIRHLIIRHSYPLETTKLWLIVSEDKKIYWYFSLPGLISAYSEILAQNSQHYWNDVVNNLLDIYSLFVCSRFKCLKYPLAVPTTHLHWFCKTFNIFVDPVASSPWSCAVLIKSSVNDLGFRLRLCGRLPMLSYKEN